MVTDNTGEQGDDEEAPAFAIATPVDPTEEQRAERLRMAQEMIAKAEEAARLAPPPAPKRQDNLHTERTWGKFVSYNCKLCAFNVLVYNDRSPEQAEEDIFKHYVTLHLGITDEDEEE